MILHPLLAYREGLWTDWAVGIETLIRFLRWTWSSWGRATVTFSIQPSETRPLPAQNSTENSARSCPTWPLPTWLHRLSSTILCLTRCALQASSRGSSAWASLLLGTSIFHRRGSSWAACLNGCLLGPVCGQDWAGSFCVSYRKACAGGPANGTVFVSVGVYVTRTQRIADHLPYRRSTLGTFGRESGRTGAITNLTRSAGISTR